MLEMIAAMAGNKNTMSLTSTKNWMDKEDYYY